jgi:hypothetical protein
MKTIAEMWQSYDRDVLPPEAGEVQRRETKRAFYAGVWSLLQQFKAVGSDDISEAQGAAILEAIQQEVGAFGARGGLD